MKLIDGVPLTEEQTIEQYRRAVYKMAHRYKLLEPYRYELDDLLQQAYIGLVEAYRNYDGSKDVKFLTYATIRMRKQIQLYITQMGNEFYFPRQTIELAFMMSNNNMIDSPDDAIAERFNVPPGRVEGAREFLNLKKGRIHIENDKDRQRGYKEDYWGEYHDLFKRMTAKQMEILNLILMGHSRESMKEVLGSQSVNDYSVRVKARKVWVELYGERSG